MAIGPWLHRACLEGHGHICNRVVAKGSISRHPKRLRVRRDRVDAGLHGCGSLTTNRRKTTARSRTWSRTPHPRPRSPRAPCATAAPLQKTQGTMSNCRIGNPLRMMSHYRERLPVCSKHTAAPGAARSAPAAACVRPPNSRAGLWLVPPIAKGGMPEAQIHHVAPPSRQGATITARKYYTGNSFCLLMFLPVFAFLLSDS